MIYRFIWFSLCEAKKIKINYENEDTAFTMEFSRIDRNITPQDVVINGGINYWTFRRAFFTDLNDPYKSRKK